MKKIPLFFILFFISFLCIADEPPLAKDIFQLSVKRIDPNTFELQWDIKSGYFLYKNRLKVINPPQSNYHLGAIHLPKALNHTNTQGKFEAIYRNHLTVRIPILGQQPGEALLNVNYQGCSDGGFCYPPEIAQIKLAINKQLALSTVNLEQAEENSPSEPIESALSDHFQHLFSTNHWGLIILSFFGFGLLLSFTPCILPMVPVLSGIIVGHSKDLTMRKAFLLSLCYVLSMSVTYAIVGAIVALMGNNLQIAMQSPYVISLFSLIFILLALSMFNFYELRLPISWQAKLASVTRNQNSGHYLSSSIMGCLSTLILSPCVTAPLIGALGYIAQTGNVTIGSLSLFFLSLGMGTPLLLIGTSAGKLLPKAGHWMNAVKNFFGVIMLALAIYLMSRILPATLTMALWASLLIFSGIYMGALTKSNSHQEKFCQGLGIIFLIYGLLILIGASQDKINPLQPLASQCLANDKQIKSMMTVSTPKELQKALTKAKGQPVMLDFYADWCASCKVMEETTFQDPNVQNALKHFVVIKINVTSNNQTSKQLLNQYHVVAPPTFLFINNKGEEFNQFRLVGEISAQEFSNHLQQYFMLSHPKTS